jgi:ectoine hydroxylase-related dioxygenase (phytanoyl-CoA dioxygenase family)
VKHSDLTINLALQVLGSHRWSLEREPDLSPGSAECAAAVMPKGSCVIYLGRTLHSGGENCSGIDRWGLNVDYNIGAWSMARLYRLQSRCGAHQCFSCPTVLSQAKLTLTRPVPIDRLAAARGEPVLGRSAERRRGTPTADARAHRVHHVRSSAWLL